MHKDKRAVAISSMFASAVLTVGKFAVGILTGSLGLISEGLHSLLDFGATILTYLAVRISDKPADAEHPYGHGKTESVAALAETMLLFVTSFWIVSEAVHRLISGETAVEATWWSAAVMVVSIVVDISRASALKRVARRTRSQALEADALHFSSDVLSSSVVLIGLGFVWIGWPEADAIAAVGVAIFVCRAGWRMGRRTLGTLIDAAPRGATERITQIAEDVEGVVAVERVRVRPAGSTLFADVDIAVGRTLSQARAFAIRRAVADAIKREIPEAEVAVASEPLALNSETVHQRVMAISEDHEAAVHHITAHHSNGILSVSFDLEVEGSRPIGDAHRIASRLEADIRAEFGEDTEVESHIEPLQDSGLTGNDVDPSELETIRALLNELIAGSRLFGAAHKVRARHTAYGLIVFFHCRTDPKHTVADVHKEIDHLEHEVRRAYPGIWRIVAHTEPDA